MFWRKPPVYFFQYALPSPSSSSSTANHPTAVVSDIRKFDRIDDMILHQYSSPLLHQSSSSFTNSARIEFQRRLHKHFVAQQRNSTETFFKNCDATHKGVTNFSDQENSSLNAKLLEAAPPSFLFCDRESKFIELGAGTGRLSPLIASTFAHQYYNNNNNNNNSDASSSSPRRRYDFVFLEPNERLRTACIQNVNKVFSDNCDKFMRESKRSKKLGPFYGSLEIQEFDGNGLVQEYRSKLMMSKKRNQQNNDEEDSLLIMSGVAQYLTDQTLVDLFSIFPRILMQEDIAMKAHVSSIDDDVDDIFSIFHERDGSLVRSEKYFEKLMMMDFVGGGSDDEEGISACDFDENAKRRRKIVGSSMNENHGCVTKTWALL